MSKKFDELMKELRLEHNENMADMAEWLGVSLPFVSAVENGKKKIPDNWLEKISKHYNLDIKEKVELENSILDCKNQIKLDISNSPDLKRKMALQFQRSFDEIDDEKAKKFIKF